MTPEFAYVTFHALLFPWRRQSEGKDRSPPRLAARPDSAAMVLDDFLANGQTQASPVRLAVCRKGLKQLAGDFWRNAAAGVLDFRDQFARHEGKAHNDVPAPGHGVGRVVNEVQEHAAQAIGI